jgi:hypothetical protein
MTTNYYSNGPTNTCGYRKKGLITTVHFFCSSAIFSQIKVLQWGQGPEINYFWLKPCGEPAVRFLQRAGTHLSMFLGGSCSKP